MAVKAFLIGNLFSQDVTLSTIGHAFQVRMHLGQFTRRDLCMHRMTDDDGQDKYVENIFNPFNP
jgi:hypothetical protein